MIAAATQNIASGKMLFNWFDVTLVAVLLFGFWRGRKNGMTKEFVPVTLWLTMVLAATFGYKPLGDLLIQQGAIRYVFGKSFSEQTAAYLSSYLLIVVVVFIVFSLFKAPLKAKLEGSNAFGSGEYYLGMICGILRYACILVFALALLNAPYYSLADKLAAKEFNNRTYGGGLAGYNGDFFPTVSEVQSSVFIDSLMGPFIKANLSILLINNGSGVGAPAKTPVISIGQ